MGLVLFAGDPRLTIADRYMGAVGIQLHESGPDKEINYAAIFISFR